MVLTYNLLCPGRTYQVDWALKNNLLTKESLLTPCVVKSNFMHILLFFVFVLFRSILINPTRRRQRDRETDRQKQRDRETETETDR